MSEWCPYCIRRKTSPSMSLSQPQSYHMSPSMEQGSHFSTDPSRLHGSFTNSSTHSTGSTNVWPGDGWMLQAASGHRSRLAPDHNVAQPVTYDHQSYLNYPALDSERLVWVHQDSVAPQQEQIYPNPTAIGNQSQFVRVISPGDRFRHRPQPYPLEGGSHTFVGSSSNASSDMRYRVQPASAPPTMSLSDQPQRQVLTDNSNRQEPSGYASGFQESLYSRRTDKDNSMSRRQRAHLDSERKRRE